jgi:hypothetical protein
METFKNVPELFEGAFEESLKARTEALSTECDEKKQNILIINFRHF